jgi:putative transposase
MIFEKGYLYHIYNQGNNRQNIFFNRQNYMFYTKKIEKYILPYSDILAWCLMPNHFHLMIRVNDVELNTSGFTPGFTLSETRSETRSINDSIGIMLRTYTRAINKQMGFTGSLFRKETKAECLNNPTKKISYFINKNEPKINISHYENQYPQICFNYIHQNPVKARLVKKAVNWEFSSARDYAGLRNGHFINMEIAEEYVDF